MDMTKIIEILFNTFNKEKEKEAKITIIGFAVICVAILIGEYAFLGTTSYISYRKYVVLGTAGVLFLTMGYNLKQIEIFNKNQDDNKNVTKFTENRLSEFEKVVTDLQKFADEQDLDKFKRKLDSYEYSTDIIIHLDVIPIIGTNPVKNDYKVTITYKNLSKVVTYKEL